MGDETRPTALQGLSSEWAAVRLKSARRLFEYQDPASIPVLIEFLADPDILNRVTVFDALRRATGQTLEYNPRASEGKRGEAIERWNGWWNRQKGTFRFR